MSHIKARVPPSFSKVFKETKDAQENIVSIFDYDEHLCERNQVISFYKLSHSSKINILKAEGEYPYAVV
jgi:hypothetical protein